METAAFNPLTPAASGGSGGRVKSSQVWTFRKREYLKERGSRLRWRRRNGRLGDWELEQTARPQKRGEKMGRTDVFY